jgi:hypothetical protein
VTVETSEGSVMCLKIERIHPDAPSLRWVHEQRVLTLHAAILYRVLSLLEVRQAEQAVLFNLYRRCHELLGPVVQEECGEPIDELDIHTELTRYGSDTLESVVKDLIASMRIVEQDLNHNWEEGLLKNFNPYQAAEDGELRPPFVRFEITYRGVLLEPGLAQIGWNTEYSAMGITCQDKY